jgi:hypothetical protein
MKPAVTLVTAFLLASRAAFAASQPGEDLQVILDRGDDLQGRVNGELHKVSVELLNSSSAPSFKSKT